MDLGLDFPRSLFLGKPPAVRVSRAGLWQGGEGGAANADRQGVQGREG